MHRIVRQPARVEPAKPSGEKGYIILTRSHDAWWVSLPPFKEVRVMLSFECIVPEAGDGDFILEIDLPEIT